jgi:hypothetical protein
MTILTNIKSLASDKRVSLSAIIFAGASVAKKGFIRGQK